MDARYDDALHNWGAVRWYDDVAAEEPVAFGRRGVDDFLTVCAAKCDRVRPAVHLFGVVDGGGIFDV